MCGILFKTSYHSKTDKKKFEEALDLLTHRGPNEEGILYNDNYSFGHKRLSIRDITNGKQPMSILNHHLIYNGEIYNTKEIIDELQNKPKSHSDTEVLLRLLIEKREFALDKLNGIFSFVYTDNKGVLASRDSIGVKPLYYTIYNDELMIASEIKCLLAYGKEAVFTASEAKELLAMYPSHTPGKTLYNGIYELKPGHYLTYDKTDGLKIYPYFEVKREKLDMKLKDIIDYTRYLVSDSVSRQLVSDVGISSFLSGGLDSSIISALAKEKLKNIDTYSIDYEGNKEDFKENEFEKTRDEDYIKLLKACKGYNHKSVVINTNTIFDYLKTAVILRDSPGMTDIDSSMLYLAKEISKKHSCGLSGECADELFGGYPWFKAYKTIDNFPWIRNIEFRESLIRKDLKDKLNIKSYLKDEFTKAIEQAPVDKDDDLLKVKELQMNYINLKYFMPTLLERKDRMTMGASLEVRVPFADKRLVNFTYNIPYHYKNYNGIEKAILREAFKDILPKEIINRKKSPYPKSQARSWHNKIKYELGRILETDTPLNKIFDINELKKLVKDDEELAVPWFGQLMRKDALMAFLYQIHYWLNEYKIRVEI